MSYKYPSEAFQRGLVYSNDEEENTKSIYEEAAKLRRIRKIRKMKAKLPVGESGGAALIPQLVSSYINGVVQFSPTKNNYGE